MGGGCPVFLYGCEHVSALMSALMRFGPQVETANRWGRELAVLLDGGGRLLVAGNGGSAAQAQHLTAELVGRYRYDRRPLSAIALHAETSSTTAIGNDYGFDEVYARQVAAHGRPGDVLLALSTSGASRNIVAAAHRSRDLGLRTWALTGPVPNLLADLADETITVDAPDNATVQEVHQVVVHLVCAALDFALGVTEPAQPDATEPQLRGVAT